MHSLKEGGKDPRTPSASGESNLNDNTSVSIHHTRRSGNHTYQVENYS